MAMSSNDKEFVTRECGKVVLRLLADKYFINHQRVAPGFFLFSTSYYKQRCCRFNIPWHCHIVHFS
uniref:Uncharacterized protein n=1 Tax=Octopus bimaculoides TaxID=37653 RepID=A0A0L8HPR4_OCTBM